MDKQVKGFLGEFKEFISRGNMMDMAVGIIVGGAFTGIVNSLVNSLLLPFINWLLGGMDPAELSTTLSPAIVEFLMQVVNFLLVSFVVFLMVKTLNRFRRKKEAAPPAPPKPSAEELLLTEIRDLLRQQAEK
ncbi:MAG: large conductance mechanosensitive channel protein MscL [Anaerotruncus sp.]|nr:large conductance mechanosensitive channel protein MscL [Anaerotruncus sp.]